MMFLLILPHSLGIDLWGTFHSLENTALGIGSSAVMSFLRVIQHFLLDFEKSMFSKNLCHLLFHFSFRVLINCWAIRGFSFSWYCLKKVFIFLIPTWYIFFTEATRDAFFGCRDEKFRENVIVFWFGLYVYYFFSVISLYSSQVALFRFHLGRGALLIIVKEMPFSRIIGQCWLGNFCKTVLETGIGISLMSVVMKHKSEK